MRLTMHFRAAFIALMFVLLACTLALADTKSQETMSLKVCF